MDAVAAGRRALAAAAIGSTGVALTGGALAGILLTEAKLARRWVGVPTTVPPDDNGFYGHPDHIQAHRITVAALDATGSQARLYFPTIRRSGLAQFRELLGELGVEVPEIDEAEFGSPDELIAAEVDCTDYAQQKFDSLAAHASQAENIFFLKLPMPFFKEMMGREVFVRERPARTDESVEDDLFAGLR